MLTWCLVLAGAFSAWAEPNIESSVTGMEVSDETIKKGAELFSVNCASCHALNGKVVGPALAGVVEKYDGDYDWLFAWIKNNTKLIKSGDERAIAIYEEYGKQNMNIFENLKDDEINAIIMYIENGGISDSKDNGGGTVAAAPEADPSLINRINWSLAAIFLLIGVIVVMMVKLIDKIGQYTGRELIKWNTTNAFLMLVFLIVGLIAAFWEISIHGKFLLLSNAASEHGAALDDMMMVTFLITGFVFVITQILLFWFSWKYREQKGRKAYYYPHNNKLEYIWTTIPAVVLTILVFGGLKVWRGINTTPEEGTQQIEVFAYQFGWQARYPGKDGELGNSNYNLISASNPLGVANIEEAKALIAELKQAIDDNLEAIEDLPDELGELKSNLGGLIDEERENQLEKIMEIENGTAEANIRLDIRRKNTQIERIENGLEEGNRQQIFNGAGNDDIVVQELHLIKGKPVTLKLRGRDVIHSAYMAHFRSQMNVVPGLPTQFTFTPTISTKEMREIRENRDFDYYIVCNKICGNAHFNMKLKIVVEDEKSYQEWLDSQSGIFVQDTEEEPTEESTESEAPAEEPAVAIN